MHRATGAALLAAIVLQGVPPASAASWLSPAFAEIARTSGALYVTDQSAVAVDIYTLTRPNQLIGQISDGLCDPYGIALDSAGTLYVASDNGGCFGDRAGPTIKAFPSGATTPSLSIYQGMFDPNQLAVGAPAETLYATDLGANVLAYAHGQVKLAGIVYPLGAATFGVALDPAGRLYASYNNDTKLVAHIGRYDQASRRFVDLGLKIRTAGGIVFDPAGNLIASDPRGGVVRVFAPGSTTPTHIYAGFGYPYTVALDAAGATLYVADIGSYPSHVTELSYPSGAILGQIDGFLSAVTGLAVREPAATSQKAP